MENKLVLWYEHAIKAYRDVAVAYEKQVRILEEKLEEKEKVETNLIETLTWIRDTAKNWESSGIRSESYWLLEIMQKASKSLEKE